MASLTRRPLAAALVVVALVLPLFAVLKHRSTPHYSVSRPDAVRIATTDPRVAPKLERYGYTKVRVTPLDGREQRVSFFNGSRLVLHASVGPNRQVTRLAVTVPGTPQSGSTIANLPSLLIGMSVLFVLAAATVPLLRVRNLDVLAFAGFTVPIWLLNQGLIEASVITAYPLLAYLVGRCLWIGLRTGGNEGGVSLYWHLAAGWSAAERRRVLKLTVAALAVMTTVLTITSSGANDVAFASLAGATDLTHGTVPYGHIPDFIVHGDTYPLLNYVLYIPAAALMPVTDMFSDPQGALIVTAAATLLAAWGVYRLAADAARLGGDALNRGDSVSEPPRITGMRAAVAWLAFPPVVLAASSGTNDVILALFLIAVLATLARRRLSVLLLGVAAWVKLIPLLALPIWLARMPRRSAIEALGWLAALSGALLVLLVGLGGPGSITAMAHAIGYQFDRGSLSSLWIGWGLGPIQPLAQAALVAIVAGATLRVRNEQLIGADLRRMAALLAATLLSAQFAANYWTWAYLPWAIAPALLVMIPARATAESRAVNEVQSPRAALPVTVETGSSVSP